MPQEFYVLKCFSCEAFQVHIVKKAKKWECKVCGAKQSLKRNYGKGSSKDCRNQVMKLNELRLSKCNNLNQMEEENSEENWTDDVFELHVKEEFIEPKPSISKWAEFMEESEQDTESEIDDNETNFILVDEKKKRMKKMPDNCYSKKKKICEEFNREDKVCEEKIELFSATSNENIFDCFNECEENADKEEFIQLKNEPKVGKYAKYLEDSNDLNQEIIKKSNIFESDLTDLDDVLNI